jgi:nudix-type nucleoside diphosphatase (YffH/AdpP family)
MEKKIKHEGWLNIIEVNDVNKNGVNINREVMTRSVGKRTDDAVAGMLYDVEKEVYYFVKQYRVGLAIRDEDPYLEEVVAGTLEKGEDPVECFKREAMEEAGFEVEYTNELHPLYTSPGGTSEKCYLFTASGKRVSKGGGLESENEDIEVISYTWDELNEIQFTDMKTQYLVNLITMFPI